MRRAPGNLGEHREGEACPPTSTARIGLVHSSVISGEGVGRPSYDLEDR
jgi:hypothetical protein